ncbi:short-chain dehydrogenase/reductase SDR [Amycolatopsis decaplanina DSM 44594]|uniref:Short-chain dehydrogenase/reductase SDR n=1 Tax=Amycolatopsis decaplanina DSM 44594 TaxID=1284240 RepID=M2YUP8_9PSEU|nr:short-chain dehydrogenase/reductase SDR [Amycolatopsis decaplanina DSM 44594]
MLAAHTESQLKAVAEEIRAEGGVAFNNGATNVPPGPMDQVTEADFDHIYAVNLRRQQPHRLGRRHLRPGRDPHQRRRTVVRVDGDMLS